MTKIDIIQVITDMERRLAELSQVVEKLPKNCEEAIVGTLLEIDLDGIKEDTGLEMIFATLRQMWKTPPNINLDMPITEIQKAMSESLPENWASREIMRMREE